jgi:hypothetical protein
VTLLNDALLGETAVSVLADCAFLILDIRSEPVRFEPDAIETRLSFSGSVSGTLRLCASRELLLGATADMLGTAPEDESVGEQVEASLRELANVLLGVLLARAFGARDCPVIGLPRSAALQELTEHEHVVCSVWLQDLEGRPFAASILAAGEGA